MVGEKVEPERDSHKAAQVHIDIWSSSSGRITSDACIGDGDGVLACTERARRPWHQPAFTDRTGCKWIEFCHIIAVDGDWR